MAEWIKCSERNPEPETDEYGDMLVVEILVWAPRFPEHRYGTYRPYSKTYGLHGSPSDFTKDITHWQPLPDPPKEAAHEQ